MKKIISAAIIITITNMANAEYSMKIPVDAGITFIPSNTTSQTETPVQQEPVAEETWTSTDPVVSEWVDSGEPYECSEWLPATDTVSTGKEFTQSADCKQNQTRTVQNYEISNTGETRKVGEETTETQVITTTESRTALGTRYTHVLNVGDYYVWGRNFYGYFSPSYVTDSSAVTNTYGAMTPNTFNGYEIDHLVEDDGAITFRILPIAENSNIHPKITIDGKDCELVGPSNYSAHDGLCYFGLNLKAGQTLYLDIR